MCSTLRFHVGVQPWRSRVAPPLWTMQRTMQRRGRCCGAFYTTARFVVVVVVVVVVCSNSISLPLESCPYIQRCQHSLFCVSFVCINVSACVLLSVTFNPSPPPPPPASGGPGPRGGLWAVRDLCRVPELRGPPLWLVCPVQHVSLSPPSTPMTLTHTHTHTHTQPRD